MFVLIKELYFCIVLTNLIITNSYFGQQTNRVMLIIRTHMKNIKMDTGYLNTGFLRAISENVFIFIVHIYLL